MQKIFLEELKRERSFYRERERESFWRPQVAQINDNSVTTKNHTRFNHLQKLRVGFFKAKDFLEGLRKERSF